MIKSLHGGDIYSRKIDLDFSANINPLGTPQSVRNAVARSADFAANYPDPNCAELKKAISVRENVPAESIVCGNGAADLIYRIALTLKPKKALVTAPTFSEYQKAFETIGCDVSRHTLSESSDFHLDDGIIDAIGGKNIVFICSPNNPVGNVVDRNVMEKIIGKCRAENAVLVIDHCFMDFVAEQEKYSVLPIYKNVIILKAFTKIYAMAGLRLGYLLCADSELCERISGCGQSWSVSIPAQMAGIAALNEDEYVKKSVSLIRREREYLSQSLTALGFKAYPSKANFILFRCGLPLDKMLLKEKIAIRNCGDYWGLGEGYFRIAVRNHDENTRLIDAIERVIKNG